MSKIIIRKAKHSDACNLTVLKQQVWIATYATEGIRNEFSEYVLNAFTVKHSEQAIEDKHRAILIAEQDNHLIACVEIDDHASCPNKSINAPEITVLYVLERFCGQAIGKQLLDAALQQLKAKNQDTCWLTVFHGNERAIRFYEKNDFKSMGTTFFEMDGNQYENLIMVRRIQV